MGNWAKPSLPDLYADFLDFLNARDIDSATLFLTDPSNQPVGAIRFSRSLNLFQEWNGTTWINKVIAQAGGGTGAGNLPVLGTMASQNANAVAITGGNINGLNSLASNGPINGGGALLVNGNINTNAALGVTTDIYVRGKYLSGPADRILTNPADGSILASAIAPASYSGAGTKVLTDNNTWVLANSIGGGVREVVHQNFDFGTDEAVKGVVVPWAGPQPASAKAWHLQFDQPYQDNSVENAGFISYSVVYNSANQATVTRTRGPNAVGPLLPSVVVYTAFHHRVETP